MLSMMFQRPAFVVVLVVLLAGCENDVGEDKDTVLNQEIADRDSAITTRDQALLERDQKIADMDEAIGILIQDIDAILPLACATIGMYDKNIEFIEGMEDRRSIMLMMGISDEIFDLKNDFKQRRSEVIGTINTIQYPENALTGESCTAGREFGAKDANSIGVATLLLGQGMGGAMNR